MDQMTRFRGGRLGRAVVPMLACFVFAIPATSLAQTAQDWSFHLSGFQTELRQGDSRAVGRGGEVQLRRTFGTFSIAIGGQFTDHPTLQPGYQLGGLLVEPRLVIDIGSYRVFPYLLARGASLRHLNANAGESLTGIDVGAGGGFIVALGKRLNFDAGAAITQTRWTFEQENLGGAANSTVQNYVVKAGLSFGIGR